MLGKKPPGKLLPSAHAVDREYRVIKALHGVGFPVPRPYALCVDDGVIGTLLYILDFGEVRVVWHLPLLVMTKSQLCALWEAPLSDRTRAHKPASQAVIFEPDS